MTRWRVGMLGAGLMAQGFDEPGAPKVLSLAHAFRRAPQFEVGGFFDARTDRAAAAEQRWDVVASPRERTAWLDSGWDVFYIATPDARHAPDLADAIERAPKAILIEKPLALDPAEGLRLLETAAARAIPVMVNFPRRWHSAVQRVSALAAEGEIDPPIAAHVFVSGDAVHNMPHTIDLFHTVWGGGWAVEKRAAAGGTTLLIWTRGAQEFPMTVGEVPASYYVWEAHFVCPQGKLTFAASPEVMDWSAPAPHPDYPTHRVLTPAITSPMENENLLERTVEALAAVMTDRRAADEALAREIDSQRLSAAAMQWFQK